jgi:hypothetical protein
VSPQQGRTNAKFGHPGRAKAAVKRPSSLHQDPLSLQKITPLHLHGLQTLVALKDVLRKCSSSWQCLYVIQKFICTLESSLLEGSCYTDLPDVERHCSPTPLQGCVLFCFLRSCLNVAARSLGFPSLIYPRRRSYPACQESQKRL